MGVPSEDDWKSAKHNLDLSNQRTTVLNELMGNAMRIINISHMEITVNQKAINGLVETIQDT